MNTNETKLDNHLKALIKHMFYNCPFNKGIKECLIIGIENNNGIIGDKVAETIANYTGYAKHYILKNIIEISKI